MRAAQTCSPRPAHVTECSANFAVLCPSETICCFVQPQEFINFLLARYDDVVSIREDLVNGKLNPGGLQQEDGTLASCMSNLPMTVSEARFSD